MLYTAIRRRYSKTTCQHFFRSVLTGWRRKESAQQRKIRQTEESALNQLPGDIFQFDSKVLNRAASFGLVGMDEGWIAGGVIAKIILSRMRSGLRAENKNSNGHSDSERKRLEAIASVDSSLPAQSLLRLREDLVKRGLIR
jgi:hypothetical protein